MKHASILKNTETKRNNTVRHAVESGDMQNYCINVKGKC